MKNSLKILAVIGLAIVAGCASEEKRDEPSVEQQAAAAAPSPAPTQAPELGTAQSEPGDLPRTITSTIPTVRTVKYKGDLNKMDQTNFEVMGVPSQVARNIITHRQSLGGQFTSVNQLRDVPGMNPDMFYSLRERVGITGVDDATATADQ